MTRLLRGKISPGMFPDERAVKIKLHDGRAISLFVHEDQVKGDAIKVLVLDTSRGKSLVLLPGEVFGATSTVTVDETELVSA